MSYRWLSGSFAAVAYAALSYGGAAFAQAQAPAQMPDSAWVKICQKAPANDKELCITTQEIRAETGQFIAGATLRQFSGEDKISFVAAVPLGMQIQEGVKVQIDEQAPKDLKYAICFQNGCFGDMPIDTAFIDALKKGGKLALLTRTQDGRQATFPFSLKGFTKTWDGPGLDPKGGQQVQSKLNEVLQQRAQEAREKLIELQQGQGTK